MLDSLLEVIQGERWEFATSVMGFFLLCCLGFPVNMTHAMII